MDNFNNKPHLMFDGENYEDWANHMRWGLAKKDLTDLLDDKDAEKIFFEIVDKNNPNYKAYYKKNTKGMSFIFERVSPYISLRVKNCKTFRELWFTLNRPEAI